MSFGNHANSIILHCLLSSVVARIVSVLAAENHIISVAPFAPPLPPPGLYAYVEL